MSFRDEVRKILETLHAIPVAVPCDNPGRMQVAILQIGKRKYGTVNANGVLYAWRNDDDQGI